MLLLQCSASLLVYSLEMMTLTKRQEEAEWWRVGDAGILM